jgi:hypothetical protein
VDTTTNHEVFECRGTHSSVAVNPEKAYRPVGGQGCCAHPWCERVKLAPHKPGASQGFSRSATGSGVDKGGLPEVPIWDNGVLRMKDEKPEEAVQVNLRERRGDLFGLVGSLTLVIPTVACKLCTSVQWAG